MQFIHYECVRSYAKQMNPEGNRIHFFFIWVSFIYIKHVIKGFTYFTCDLLGSWVNELQKNKTFLMIFTFYHMINKNVKLYYLAILSWADNSVKHWWNCLLAILIQIYFISMHVPSLVETPWQLLKLLSRNENMGVSWADNSVKIWQNYPLAILNQIFTISMHLPSLVKIHWPLLNFSSGNENWACLRQITPSKFDKICPSAIPKQISTISMHIPSLVKICWCLLKLSFGHKIRMDGRMGTDGQTQGRPTWKCITPPLSCGAE